ncbi:hypothetical protein KUH03_11875 [Sphingobacterium sp. E70]|uniref:hypothetical protein n=1 Tax=Sphingobacterium sp. E70 TaxID=2853439 RepID=UPI00211C978B|nr:hypothetical protein [Sphingobacterium sp. E70]ULT27378.1 hypothetical protein KUH03_11875 [Sphingobacterium sp. E70]
MSTDGKMTNFAPSLYEVDIDFIPNMGIKMAAGRAYSRDFPADSAHSLVINESAAKLWGIQTHRISSENNLDSGAKKVRSSAL